jgi:hypothetical protein
MAKSGVLKDTGETIVSLLKSAIGTMVSDVALVTPEDIKSISPSSQSIVTVFLYRIAVEPSTRNAPRRLLPDGTYTRPLLPLALSYLITPWAVSADVEHQILGAILQRLYDRSEVGSADLQGTSWDAGDSLQLVLESLSLEDHYRIWDAFDVPYRVSVAYTARIVGIEPTEIRGDAPVVSARFGAPP